jgi:chemotaxis protein methyltransferase CheR
MTVKPENFDFIRQVLQRHAAIALSDNKTYLVETRLLPVARSEDLGDVNALIDRLRISPSEPLLRKVVEALTTNETSFFRDGAPFNILRDTVLPELIRRRASVQALNIWSAGCASGQEPYTIAMLWRERFAHLTDWRLKLLATDISNEMLQRARDGRFTPLEVNRGLPAKYCSRYFRREGDSWLIDERLRTMVEFRLLNFIGEWPKLPLMDVVFMRNVLVYFDMSTKQEVLRKVRGILRPDGYLFLGGTETTLMIDDAFDRISTSMGSYYSPKSALDGTRDQ